MKSDVQLDALGWSAFFAEQVRDEDQDLQPVRIAEVHRNGFHAIGAHVDQLIPSRPDATVGDWLLFDEQNPTSSRLLARHSLIKRRAAGSDRQMQLIAANIDTVFIVTSCNQDFNIARLERYVALALEADVQPVIIITKPDLSPNPQTYAQSAKTIADDLPVLLLNARTHDAKQALAKWCASGQTIAFLGSSGVGKSTLANALSVTINVETQAVRAGDDKGRHTTTSRQLHFVPDGCAVLDTPGMRELQLADTARGLDDLFADLNKLATECKFNDCRHKGEPGCAIRAAIENDELDQARLERWIKLSEENKQNTNSLIARKPSNREKRKQAKSVSKPRSR